MKLKIGLYPNCSEWDELVEIQDLDKEYILKEQSIYDDKYKSILESIIKEIEWDK